MLARRIIRMLVCMSAVPSLSDPPAHALERMYLNKPEVEQTLIAKGAASRNLATGMASHWEVRPEGPRKAS